MAQEPYPTTTGMQVVLFNCALSGFLITQKGKLLIFSVLTNNYITGATPVRRAVEKFLLGIREKY